MKIQVGYDWSKTYTVQALEKDLPVSFDGPGIYATDSDTLLVVPLPPDGAPDNDTIWAMEQPKDTLYQVYAWNVPVQNTVLGLIGQAPMRMDNRNLVSA